MKNLESDVLKNKIRQHPLFSSLQNMASEIYESITSTIVDICPPSQERKTEYHALLHDFEEKRGTSLFYPYIGSGLGKGPYVLLEDGSIKLDFITGIGPNYWGHSPKDYLPKALEALFLSDTIMQGNLQPNRSGFDLIDVLTRLSGFDHCFITTSGAMSGENALKLLFQKGFPKQRILAFEHAFAGRSLAMSQITDKAAYRKGLPNVLQVDYIPFYQHEIGVEKSLVASLKSIDHHLLRYPNSHVALCAELIQGEGGFRVGHPEYFKKLFSALHDRGIYIWVDEVQTFGRTENIFACQTFDIIDLVDILTIGKVSQVCATLFRAPLKPSPGLISQTFTASSSAIHAALWGIEKSIEEGHYGESGKIAQLHTYFTKKLNELHTKYPEKVSGPWGIGSMISFTPFQGEENKTTQFAKKLFDNGLIGFICGARPTKIRFLLPVGAMETKHIDQAIDVIERTLTCF